MLTTSMCEGPLSSKLCPSVFSLQLSPVSPQVENKAVTSYLISLLAVPTLSCSEITFLKHQLEQVTFMLYYHKMSARTRNVDFKPLWSPVPGSLSIHLLPSFTELQVCWLHCCSINRTANPCKDLGDGCFVCLERSFPKYFTSFRFLPKGDLFEPSYKNKADLVTLHLNQLDFPVQPLSLLDSPSCSCLLMCLLSVTPVSSLKPTACLSLAHFHMVGVWHMVGVRENLKK